METASYAASEVAICQQPSALSFIILDEGMKALLQSTADVRRYTKLIIPETEHLLSTWTSQAIEDHVRRGDLIKAESIEQLAQRIGVPPANLRGSSATTRISQEESMPITSRT
jgi:hypothetical protein